MGSWNKAFYFESTLFSFCIDGKSEKHKGEAALLHVTELHLDIIEKVTKRNENMESILK